MKGKLFLLTFALLGCLALPASANILIPNGDFSDGSANWLRVDGTGQGPAVTSPTGGNPGGYGSVTPAGGWGILVSPTDYPAGVPIATLGLTAGGPVTFTYDSVNLSGPGPVGGFKWEAWGNNKLLGNTGDVFPTVIGDGSTWQTYTYSWVLPPNTEKLVFVPLWAGGGNTSTVGFDNVGVISVELALSRAATKAPFDPATDTNWSSGGLIWSIDNSMTHDGLDSVQAKTRDGESTYREYAVTGPAVVDFWWKVSSEQIYDTFSYSINDVNQETISGEVDWSYRTLMLPAGTHTIRWTYAKDGSDFVGQDAGWLDDFAVYPAKATLQVRDGSIVLDGDVTVDFGSADQGIAGLTKLLTFTNEGYIPLEVQLSLPAESPFTFEGSVTVYDILLGRGETLDVPITLSADARGTKTAQLTIIAPDSSVSPPQVTLLAGATLQVRDGAIVLSSTATVDFGSADYGSAGATKSLTFVNVGCMPLDAELSLPEGSHFTFEGGAVTRNVLLGRGDALNIPITLIPAVRGPKAAQLTINAPGSTSTPPEITLTGNVLGPVIGVTTEGLPLASGQTIDLGLAPRTLQFTISNTGNVGNLEIAQMSATGNFRIAQQPQTSIAPQGSTTFTVLALGGSSGLQSGTVTITSNDTLSEAFTINLNSKSLFSIGDGITSDSVATSGTGGAVGWDFAMTQLPSGQSGQALKTGTTPNNGGSVLEFTAQTAGVLSWSWKVGSQENFDWLLCEVDGQEVAGISAKNGVWQTQVVQVPAGANVRWVYRKDAAASVGEDAGYLADVEFRSFTANQSFSQWAQANGISDPQQRMPKSGLQAMFGWLGGFGVDGENTDDHHKQWILSGRLTYRYPISKTADGTQTILYSSDMSSWTTRRISQRVVSEDADRMVIEATAPSGTKGFFKVVGAGDTSMVRVEGGLLPQSSGLVGTTVGSFKIGVVEVTWNEWQEVRAWALSNGYTDFLGVGAGSAGNHPVHSVSWFDVVKWCNAKSEMKGLSPVYQAGGATYRTGNQLPTIVVTANGYRLPTNAECVWAAIGGMQSEGFSYSGSNDANLVAWHWDNSIGAAQDQASGRGTWPVRTKVSNELGIFDMSGNVWEWCANLVGGTSRSIYGGSWRSFVSFCAVEWKDYSANPYDRLDFIGFRVTRNAED